MNQALLLCREFSTASSTRLTRAYRSDPVKARSNVPRQPWVLKKIFATTRSGDRSTLESHPK